MEKRERARVVRRVWTTTVSLPSFIASNRTVVVPFSLLFDRKQFRCKQLDHNQLVSVMFFFISKFSLPLNFMNGSVYTHSIDTFFMCVTISLYIVHHIRTIEMVTPSNPIQSNPMRENSMLTNFYKFNWTKTKILLINSRIHWFVWEKAAFIIVNWENFLRQKMSKHTRKKRTENWL